MTDECRTMREQAYRMKEAWKNTSQKERSRQKCEREQQKQKEQNELHEMSKFSNQCKTCLSNRINVIIRTMIRIWTNLTN
jgi:hypothetical protein